jgi:hypothetical protein
MQETKFCKDCRYSGIPSTSGEISVERYPDAALCYFRPQQTKVNLVSGDTYKIPNYCVNERGVGDCGKEGKNFSARGNNARN